MSLDDNKQVILRFVEEALNKKNLDAMDELVAEDFVEQVPFPGQGPGREGLKQAVGGFISAFPDMHWTIEEQVAEEEKVWSRFTITGTHQGEFMGLPATGRSIYVWGVVMDVVRDGVMAESRMILDMVGLMGQLGMLPGP